MAIGRKWDVFFGCLGCFLCGMFFGCLGCFLCGMFFGCLGFLSVWDVFCWVWDFWVFGMCFLCGMCFLGGWDFLGFGNFWLGCCTLLDFLVGMLGWIYPLVGVKKKIKARCAFQKVMVFLLGFHQELLKKMLVLFEPIPDKYCRCVLKRSQFLWGKFTFNDWISENTSLRKVHSPKREGNEKQISWLIFNGQSTTPTHVPPLEIRPY